MSYLSLYRKWRPRSFADVVGQAHVVRTLRNALTSGRIAHAYLFCGPRGTGKTSVARLLAKGLNCEHGPTADPCEQCESCERIDKGISMDVVEIDGASNRGIDEVRDLRENVKFAPTEGQYKVYIIDEVHMLTTDAFNALLKTLEEPPAHVVFVFATTEPHKIPATILSRCQRFDFKRFTEREITTHLKRVVEREGVRCEEGALSLISRHAAGGMRDALGLLDQCLSFADDVITVQAAGEVLGVVSWDRLLAFAELLLNEDTAGAIGMVQETSDQGKDLRQFIVDFLGLCRDLMLVKAGVSDVIPDEAGSSLERLSELADRMTMEDILFLTDVFSRAENDVKWASQSRLPVEMAVIRVTKKIGHMYNDDQAIRVKGKQDVGSLESGPVVESLRRELTGRFLQIDDELGQLRRSVERLTECLSDLQAESGSDVPSLEENPGDTPDKEPARSTPNMSELVAGNLTVADVAAKWEQILETLREQRKVTTAALLREGRPAKIEAGQLTIVFPGDKGFHKASLENAKNRNPVEQVLAGIFSRPITIDCRFESEVDPDCLAEALASSDGKKQEAAAIEELAQPVGEPRAQETVSPVKSKNDRSGDEGESDAVDANHPLVKAALDLFDGRLQD